MTPDPDRAARAAEALADGRVRIRPAGSDTFEVDSFTTDATYRVTPTGCSCPDATIRGAVCKHELAVRLQGE